MPAVDDDDDDDEDVIAPLPPARKRHDVKFSDCEMRPSQANAAKTKTANAAKTKPANGASAKWCAVSIADAFDGELIPGVLLDAKGYVKKASDAKLRAVRLLNSDRVLLLPTLELRALRASHGREDLTRDVRSHGVGEERR